MGLIVVEINFVLVLSINGQSHTCKNRMYSEPGEIFH